MGAAVAIDGFGPGAQVPLMGTGGGTGATNALASAAYRDSPLKTIQEADNDLYKTAVKGGKWEKLFRPDLGEAFSRAVQVRMLGGGRKALIQSFGAEPQPVVEHCLAATHIRRQRDARLTLVTFVCGVLFLPGLLIWLGVVHLRRIAAAPRTSGPASSAPSSCGRPGSSPPSSCSSCPSTDSCRTTCAR